MSTGFEFAVSVFFFLIGFLFAKFANVETTKDSSKVQPIRAKVLSMYTKLNQSRSGNSAFLLLSPSLKFCFPF